MTDLILGKALKGLVFCSGNNFFLQSRGKITEVIAVAGHAHNQVAVLLRVLPGGPQGVGINHVELDMMTIQLEVGAYQLGQFV